MLSVFALRRLLFSVTLGFVVAVSVMACGDDSDPALGYVAIKNDFNNPEMAYQPPWTICKLWYNGVFFDGVLLAGATSDEQSVDAGIGRVLMVAAWDDPDCKPENCLPLASKNEEEVVEKQHRVINLNMPNHQGPCPPEGVAPIPEASYNKILELWPEYNFKPYAERTENTQCLDE